MGGKFNLGKYLAPIVMESNPGKIIEPFLGGGNFMTHIFKAGYSGEYIAGDFDPDVNHMWSSVLEGWLPRIEDRPSREKYNEMKAADFSPDPLRGFVRSVASFGASPWTGYALDAFNIKRPNQDIWGGGVKGMERDAKIIRGKDVRIVGGDYSAYSEHIETGAAVYCDPPYMNTPGYRNGEEFDAVRFWDTVRDWSKACPVYVSELTAPDDFVPVYQKEYLHRVGGAINGKTVGEKLFMHESLIDKR